MFAPNQAKTVEEYLANIPDERKDLVLFLHNFIQKTSPKLTPHFAHNMIGYGSFPYKNYKKEMITWPTIALANQKQYVSIYVCSIVDREYIAEKYKGELGKVSVGKSCIRLKKLEDLNLKTLRKIIKLAEKNPGLTIT